MHKIKLPYKEGDWVAVPLRRGGYAIGIIARAQKGGKALFGYFFGPKHNDIPLLENARNLKPLNSILICHYGDLGLINHKWIVLGQYEPWDRQKWPMAVFVRRDSISNKPRKVYYSDDDPSEEIREELCSEEDVLGLPKDGISGSGAVEIILTKILCT